MTTWQKSFVGSDKAELPVKLDYSDTYRENDQLDLDLFEHLAELHRAQRRRQCDRDEELEVARASADKILRLKTTVSSREGESPNDVFPQEMRAPQRKHSVSESEDEAGATTVLVKSTLSDRRIAKERDRYSAKNLFNVVRRRGSKPCLGEGNNATTIRMPMDSPNGLRTASAPTACRQQVVQTVVQPHSRPGSYRAPADCGYGAAAASSLNARRATSAPPGSFSKRLYGNSDETMVRRPRSRRELERLCSLKIDPFEEESVYSQRTSNGNSKTEVLENLRKHNSELQSKVSDFIKQLEIFNKKGRKSRLDHILEEN